MDYKSYITALEEQLERMTEKQKTEWIYAQARIVGEDKRQEFLDSLSGKKNLQVELTPDAILDWCDQIEEGEICIEAEPYEYYEEGDWERDFALEYHDNSGVMPYLVKAINTCYQLLLLKEYDAVSELLDRICGLEFYSEYTYDYAYDMFDGEADGLTLKDLVKEKLVSIDFRELSLCLLYSCYQANDGQDRLDKIYEYLTWDICKGIKLTDVFAYGPEKIEDELVFMKVWRDYLIPIPGDHAAELLVDACIYIGNDDYLLETARMYVKEHPYLYKVCCERKYQYGDYSSCIEIARQAVEEIGKNLLIRADIADIGVKAAHKVADKTVEERLIQEAFYSNPNSWHLLRLHQLKGRAVYSEELERIRTLREITYREVLDRENQSMEKREATIKDEVTRDAFRFLLGDYAAVLKKCGRDENYLGWGSASKGIIVPLLLLYLKNDNEEKTQAEKKLIENLRYKLQFESKDGEAFDTYLSAWRKNYEMPEEHRQKCVAWLLEEIDKRTEAVVGGGYRHSYHKAAEIIVLVGAIQEEAGVANGMWNLIEYYKKQHSRKRAFRQEIDELAEKN